MTYTDNLTKQQERMIRLLVSEWDHGRSITYREICKVFGFSSDQAIATHLHALEAKGFVTLDSARYSLTDAALEKFSTRWQRVRAFPTIGETISTDSLDAQVPAR